MSRLSLMQRMRPFLLYVVIIIPVVLFFTVVPAGIFPALNTQVSTEPDPVLAEQVNFMDNIIDKKKNSPDMLVPSIKYAAGGIPGVESGKDVKVISGTHFGGLITDALTHSRKRKMVDFTKLPASNTMQTLINTWTDGSYSPVHRHNDYSEVNGASGDITFV